MTLEKLIVRLRAEQPNHDIPGVRILSLEMDRGMIDVSFAGKYLLSIITAGTRVYHEDVIYYEPGLTWENIMGVLSKFLRRAGTTGYGRAEPTERSSGK